jgi:hypothetical protein
MTDLSPTRLIRRPPLAGLLRVAREHAPSQPGVSRR